MVRTEEGRSVEGSVAALDDQTVRADGHGGTVGYDAVKKAKGRKRFILVDVLGLLLGVDVAPSGTQERGRARPLLEPALPWLCTLRKLWVDGGYSGLEFAGWVSQQAPQLDVEVIKPSDDMTGFHVLPKRWVVERTLGWLMKHCRLVRDYEKAESSAVAWIVVALIRIMLGRLI